MGERLLLAAAMLDIDDPTLQQLWPMYHQYEMELRGLLDSGLGWKHPQVLEVQGQLDKTKEILLEAVTSVKKVLPTKLQMAQQAVERAKDFEEGKKDETMDERRKAAAEYLAASKDYELEKNMRANMQARFDIEQVDLTMPKVPITVHEHAEPVPATITGEAKAKVLTWASPGRNPIRKTWTPSLLWGAGIGLLAGLLLLIALGRRTGER